MYSLHRQASHRGFNRLGDVYIRSDISGVPVHYVNVVVVYTVSRTISSRERALETTVSMSSEGGGGSSLRMWCDWTMLPTRGLVPGGRAVYLFAPPQLRALTRLFSRRSP